MTRTRIIVGLAALATLGGCQTLEDVAQPAARTVAAPSHPTYCYRTLAAVNCYLTPRPGDTLVGIDVPPPQRPSAAAPAPARPDTAPTPVAPDPMAMPTAAQPVASEPVGTAPSTGPAQLSPYGNGSRNSQN